MEMNKFTTGFVAMITGVTLLTMPVDALNYPILDSGSRWSVTGVSNRSEAPVFMARRPKLDRSTPSQTGRCQVHRA